MTDKMKITLLIDTLGAGGAQRQLVGLACLLKDVGYDVEVITYYHIDFYKNILSDMSIRCIYLKEANRKNTRIYYIWKYIRVSKPQVVIAYQSMPSLIASVIRCFNHSFKLIVSERNTSQNYSILDWLRFNLYRVADWVVPNSYSQADFIKKHARYLAPKIRVIVNFVDLNKFSLSNTEVYQQNNKTLHILTLARITPQKNIIKYLYALKKVKDSGADIIVDWYGYMDGDGSYYNECLNKIIELGLQNIFHFHEPTKDVVSKYRNCNVFCLPSLYEGTPNVVCEAMSCGVPILCSDVCDNSKIVKNNVNGFLFNPLIPDEIASSIIKFSKLSIEQRSDMSCNSRKIAESLFSQQLFLERYKAIID